MSSGLKKRWLTLVAGGLLAFTSVPATWGTTIPAAGMATGPATSEPHPHVRKPVCLCGFGVTEKQIEAAEMRRRLKRQMRRQQAMSSAKPAVTNQHSERGN